MTEILEFPACLQRPDLSGTIRVRSPKTEETYRARYRGMEKTLTLKCGYPASVTDVIEDLRQRAPFLKPNSYYLYQAAVMQELRDWYLEGSLSNAKAQRLVDRMVLDGGSASIGKDVVDKRTSAGCAKHVRPDTLAALESKARADNHQTSQNLAGLLEFGVKTGVRPCELFGARLKGRKLSILSAKFSGVNGRGLGEVREISLLDDFDDFDLDGLRRLLVRLSEEMDAVGGDRTCLVRRYGAALRRLRGGLPSASRVTLKTTRSQCRATLARAGYSREEIAALFGQASGETAASNYGSVKKGWRPIQGHTPIAASSELVAQVRPGARTKAKLARNQPLTVTEFRATRARPKTGF